MRGRTKIAILLALAGLIAGVTPVLASSSGQGLKPITGYTGKIENRVLSDTAAGRETSIVINLTQQADLSAAYGMRDEDAQGWYVYRTLKRTADRTQSPIKALLKAQGVSYKSFWAANTIVAQAVDRALVQSLAARPDVKVIESNKPSNWLEADQSALAETSFDSVSMIEASAPEVIEPGVNQVKAPNVWALGFNGTGIVVAVQDTGVRWTHNALKPHYRGWNGSAADHNYNWWDAIHSGGGICTPNHQEPCDDFFHGSHVTGTAVGDDGNPGPNQIGVAPGAKWIGCRNMDQGNGTPATYTECFQFFMAPTNLQGQNPDPTRRPHVMNNSWGCPASEGCAADTLRQVVENTQAAGIFVEVSAGNAGPSCSSVNDPPAIYAASYSTGALTTGTTSVVGFSSRGPVTLDGSGRIKPDIVAPGTNTRSATNAGDASYGTASGTSMAGPHVVGVVALLWQAVPSLNRDIAGTKARLNGTANPNITPNSNCGPAPPAPPIPNNNFGYGLVDALAAVQGGGPPPPPHHHHHHHHHHLHLHPAAGRTSPRCRRRCSGPQRRPTAPTSTPSGATTSRRPSARR